MVFGQSFHWVEPRQALPKIATILSPGGRLALLWDRLTPTARSELRAGLEKRIGDGGVDAENSAIALICTPH